MHVAPLRKTVSRFRIFGQLVTLDHDHLVKEIDQDAARKQAGQAAADDEGPAIFWPADGGARMHHCR
jgi:hypothetical protein